MIPKAAHRLAACFILLLSVSSISSLFSQHKVHSESIVNGLSLKDSLRYTFSISVLGGLSTRSDYIYDNISRAGLHFDLTGILFFDEREAVKLDIGYTTYNAQYVEPPLVDPEFSLTHAGGDVTDLSVKGNYLVGSFVPQRSVLFYGSAGVGLINRFYSQLIGSAHPEETKFVSFISLGLGLLGRVSEHFGLHAEAEFQYETSYVLNGDTHFVFRAGAAYIFF